MGLVQASRRLKQDTLQHARDFFFFSDDDALVETTFFKCGLFSTFFRDYGIMCVVLCFDVYDALFVLHMIIFTKEVFDFLFCRLEEMTIMSL